jgi:hypothetical protein
VRVRVGVRVRVRDRIRFSAWLMLGTLELRIGLHSV